MKTLPLVLLFLVATTTLAQTRDSLDIKIGQMLLIGYPGPELDSTVLKEVREGKVGSIILFEKNVPKSATAFYTLKKVLWTYQKAAPIPLLITIDQEGGRVNRLKDKYGFPKSITAQASGKATTLDSVRFNAESIASNLAGLGFNVNFAPVVDVAIAPNNPAIVKPGRSFSPNHDSVTLLAREYIKPHRRFGVITVLKHFLGQGSAQDDTHFGIADVTNTWTEAELKPYKELLRDGYVDAVMSAHIVNRKLDPEGFPGTMSKRMVDSLLRKAIGFDGVVFSDDMQMHAISKQYGLEEAVKRAVKAGIDILCFSNNIQNTEARNADIVHQIIKKMVVSGEIPRERIDQSYRRIMKLKSRLQTTASQAEFYQLEATKERVRADALQAQIDELKAQAETKDKKEEEKEEIVRPFQLIQPTGEPVPILLSVPHCGTEFPPELKRQYKADLIAAPDDTDWFVHRLYDFAAAMGITMIHSTYSRWVIDLNRDPESKPLYTDGRIITALCPATTFTGESLYVDGRTTVDPGEVNRRIEIYYKPYHDQVAKKLLQLKSRFGKVLLWECHSIRQKVPTVQPIAFPDLILGDNDGAAAGHEIIDTALSVLKKSGKTVNHNHPFKGGYITRYFGKPSEGQHAIQLEMTKVNYMDDAEKNYDEKRASVMRKTLTRVFEELISKHLS